MLLLRASIVRCLCCRAHLSSSSSSSQSHGSTPPQVSHQLHQPSPASQSERELLPRIGHFHLDPFTPADYAERRGQLFQEFTRRLATDNKQFADFDRHLLLVPSAQQQYMAFHVPYTLRQNSYLRYLTGHLGQDSLLVLGCDSGGGDFDTAALLVHRQTDTERLWDGEDSSAEAAAQKAGLLTGLYTEDEEAGKFLADQLARTKGKLALWYNYKEPSNLNLDRGLILSAIKRRSPQAVSNIEPVIDRLRWRKSAKEVAVMRRAGVVGSRAMNAAISATQPGINEAMVWAVLDFECRRLGAERLAYPPVIGGGARSTIIHYMKNSCPVNPPELILADSGAEVAGYVSDVTRTWPASGAFTAQQRIAYDIVRQLLADCRGFCRPGVSLDEAHMFMARQMRAYLLEASVLTDSGRAMSQQALCHALCPHHLSHYLGMDVHDTPSMPRSEPLQPGVAFPLEPGIYLPAGCGSVRPEFQGLGGIRLEDDFVMGEDGKPELLTGEAALEADEVERLAGAGQSYTVNLGRSGHAY